jgi:hypothetical protein
MNISKIEVDSQRKYPNIYASKEELTELDRRLSDAFIECLQGISRDHEEIIRKYNSSKDKAFLSKGVWYPVDYIRCLRTDDPENLGEKRYQWLRSKGYLSSGYLDHKLFDPIDNTFAGFRKRRTFEFRVKKECIPF